MTAIPLAVCGPFHLNFVLYSMYPFNHLPNFEPHTHYHFVIINTGKKLFQIKGMDGINFERDFPFLHGDEGSPTRTVIVILHNIYVAWTLASETGTPRKIRTRTLQALFLWSSTIEAHAYRSSKGPGLHPNHLIPRLRVRGDKGSAGAHSWHARRCAYVP